MAWALLAVMAWPGFELGFRPGQVLELEDRRRELYISQPVDLDLDGDLDFLGYDSVFLGGGGGTFQRIVAMEAPVAATGAPTLAQNAFGGPAPPRGPAVDRREPSAGQRHQNRRAKDCR